MAQYPRQVTLWLTIATCVINSLVVFLWSRRYGIDKTYSYVGHDYPEAIQLPFGKLDDVLLTVEESSRYTLDGKASDELWEYNTPKASGFLSLGPDDRMFLVAAFHQTHCLRFFNWAFDPKFEGIYKIFASKGHNAHCLNYHRQVTLCAADLTLERGDFVTRNFEVDRVGSTHTCKDWSALYKVIDDNWEARKKLLQSHP